VAISIRKKTSMDAVFLKKAAKAGIFNWTVNDARCRTYPDIVARRGSRISTEVPSGKESGRLTSIPNWIDFPGPRSAIALDARISVPSGSTRASSSKGIWRSPVFSMPIRILKSGRLVDSPRERKP
jgi:hypothetical protein